MVLSIILLINKNDEAARKSDPESTATTRGTGKMSKISNSCVEAVCKNLVSFVGYGFSIISM